VSSSSQAQQELSTREVLAGTVERVTFHNAENGFCVLRIKARGHRDLITVVGHAAVIAAGEWVTASGEWVNDRTHGQQFKSRFMRTSAPTSIDGIEKYLGSGMIRGIGPVYARKMVRAFGEKVGRRPKRRQPRRAGPYAPARRLPVMRKRSPPHGRAMPRK
jgi:exodeoxyribonuclease V alpha subunit